MEKITKEPVIGAEFTDTTSGIEKIGNEISWPSSYAYSVRAVNAWGIESGPSPVALGLPEAPGPVEIVPWADGRRLVVWKPANISELSGFSLMRMDDWDARHVYRLHAAPVPTAGYWDDNPFPTGDRRIYHVSGIDVNGSLGIPTSSGWSHGLP
jgi:hypothetical protein